MAVTKPEVHRLISKVNFSDSYLPYAGAEGVSHRERRCYRGVWSVFGNFAEEKERKQTICQTMLNS